MTKGRIILCAACILSLTHADAVIVGGVNGDGFNNAGESTLQGFLSAASAPAFPYWDNLIRYSDASSVYLGYNASTMEGWVLSAHHITETTGITIQGHAYSFIDPLPGDPNINGYRITVGATDTDLILYRFSVGGADPIPTLPTLPILDDDVAVDDALIMAGRGMRSGAGTVSEDTTAPYTWGAPGTSDSVPFRWGSNTVDEIGLTDAGGALFFSTTFDSPGTGTTFDGQAALSDSGGGAFILRDGQWWLGGLMYGVDDGPDAGTAVNPAGYGDITYFSDVTAYRGEILALTGTLVPEPSVMLLGAVSLLTLCHHRRR